MTAPLVEDARPVRPSVNEGSLSRRGRILLWAFQMADRDWQGRGLTFLTPDRQAHDFGPASPERAVLDIRDWRFFRRILAGGAIGLAESYVAAEWVTPDLARTLIVLADNFERLGRLTSGNAAIRAFNWAVHNLGRLNTRAGAKRNIVAHYDLGNDFYGRWLDPSMTYSSALFDDQSADLTKAQHSKYSRILDRIDGAAKNILEVGCGWGGFAEAAANQQRFTTGLPDQLDLPFDRALEKEILVPV